MILLNRSVGENKGLVDYRKFLDDLEYKFTHTGVKWTLQSNDSLSAGKRSKPPTQHDTQTQNEAVTEINEGKTALKAIETNENDVNWEVIENDKVFAEIYPAALKPIKLPKELQQLNLLLKKDNFHKENLHTLRTIFIGWAYTEEGLLPTIEFEEALKKGKTGLSWGTIDSIISLITAKNDKGKVSYFKLKNMINSLQSSQFFQDNLSSQNVRSLMTDFVEPRTAPHLNSKSELKQITEAKDKESRRDAKIEAYLNQIEIRLEEKFRNIAHAFRTFDTDGDSMIQFDEFWVGLNKVGIYLDKQACLELFNYLDQNNDKVVEFNEFWDFFENLKTNKGDYQKYSKNATLNFIHGNMDKEAEGKDTVW